MTFEQVKTSELTGAALDWAVAKCEYDNRRYHYGSTCFNPTTKRVYETEELRKIGVSFAPSSDWKQGGPIVERECIGLTYADSVPSWYATSQQGKRFLRLGETPLEAAMRCYVASKLGDTVEIPEDLL